MHPHRLIELFIYIDIIRCSILWFVFRQTCHIEN